MNIEKNSALVLVDLQNDFCPGGNFPVAHGDEVIPIANKIQPYFDIVVATQDWHPSGHSSFASSYAGKSPGDLVMLGDIEQVLWPDHCVQNTKGADFYPSLNCSHFTKIFHKGVDKNIDGYSAFYDNAHLRDTGLGDYLRSEGVETIYMMGLATDYCVKFSCLDALQLGFNVCVIENGCRGIEFNSGDVAASLQAMKNAGAQLLNLN